MASFYHHELQGIAPIQECRPKYTPELLELNSVLSPATFSVPYSTGQLKQRQRRNRTMFSGHTLARLEAVFAVEKYPGIVIREQLSQELGVPEARIQTWFQNKRSRTRRQKVSKHLDEHRHTPEPKKETLSQLDDQSPTVITPQADASFSPVQPKASSSPLDPQMPRDYSRPLRVSRAQASPLISPYPPVNSALFYHRGMVPDTRLLASSFYPSISSMHLFNTPSGLMLPATFSNFQFGMQHPLLADDRTTMYATSTTDRSSSGASADVSPASSSPDDSYQASCGSSSAGDESTTSSTDRDSASPDSVCLNVCN